MTGSTTDAAGSSRPGDGDRTATEGHVPHDPNDRAFAFRDREILVRREGSGLGLPDDGELRTAGLAVRASYPTEGTTAGDVALDLEPGTEPPEGMEFVGVRGIFGGLPDPLVARVGAAYQTVYWHRRHQHCGRCGAPTRREGAPRGQRRCAECGNSHFLNPTPAIIVLVHRGDRMLLARARQFPEGLFSTLAGFVEPGESLEDAVHREVREEVGVELERPEYFGSQPWPFPNSLMVGFTARWRDGEIRVDGEEIGEAAWFAPGEPPRVPPPLSIARRMIDRFVRDHGGDPSALRSWQL